MATDTPTAAQTASLTAVAEELYALAPEDFTAARNARAKAAKPDDAELAARIGALRKPSPAAWIANALAREHADALDEVVALGAELRDAQAAGDGRALTRLAGERRTLVASLLQQAARLADAADRTPSRAVLDEVEQTLIAGTVDAAAGDAVRTGRLVRSLQAVGLDAVDLDGAVAGEASAGRPVPASRAPASKAGAAEQGDATGVRADAAGRSPDDVAAERARAEHERAEADARDALARADDAARALAEAEEALHDAEARADRLRAERDGIEARLRELRTELAAAERDEREAERAHAKAATAADRARDHAEAAEAARDRLA